MKYWTTIASAVGELRLTCDDEALTGVDFLGPMPSGPDEARSVRLHEQRGRCDHQGHRCDQHPVLEQAAAELAGYFSGSATGFSVPVAPGGTSFQQRVWAELNEIGYGETATYGHIAQALGLTGHGARAVGMANGRNPIPIVIPCHRVVGANGSMTGYGGGISRKRLLLELESPGLWASSLAT